MLIELQNACAARGVAGIAVLNVNALSNDIGIYQLV
jgi:hypothetical protein